MEESSGSSPQKSSHDNSDIIGTILKCPKLNPEIWHSAAMHGNNHLFYLFKRDTGCGVVFRACTGRQQSSHYHPTVSAKLPAI